MVDMISEKSFLVLYRSTFCFVFSVNLFSFGHQLTELIDSSGYFLETMVLPSKRWNLFGQFPLWSHTCRSCRFSHLLPVSLAQNWQSAGRQWHVHSWLPALHWGRTQLCSSWGSARCFKAVVFHSLDPCPFAWATGCFAHEFSQYRCMFWKCKMYMYVCNVVMHVMYVMYVMHVCNICM